MQSSNTRQAIVIGGLMVLFGGLLLVQEFTELNEWIWVAVLVVSGLAVYGVYSVAREEGWMLIISYVLLAIGLMITLITLDILQDAYVASFVMLAIAIPFVYGYFRSDQEAWGLLIPAYVMAAIGIMVPLLEGEVLTDEAIPAYVMFAVALPFLVVFAVNTKQWWALIVGGILAIAGISFLFAMDLVEYILPITLILVGGGILVRLLMRGEQEEAEQEVASEESAGG